MPDRELFKTNVGSHMWHMDHPGSDVDTFVAYQAPSADLLLERRHSSAHTKDATKDEQRHEIGMVVRELLKSNVNVLWGIFSPIVLSGHEVVEELRIRSVVTKQCYNSIHGLAVHNYQKYIQTGKDTRLKRCGIIVRTLLFGISLLDDGKLKFEPVSKELCTPGAVKLGLVELDRAYAASPLPEEPSKEQVKSLEDWLFNLRIKDLMGPVSP